MTNSIARITSKGQIYDIADLQARVKLDVLEEELQNQNQNSTSMSSRIDSLTEDLRKGEYAFVADNIKIIYEDNELDLV